MADDGIFFLHHFYPVTYLIIYMNQFIEKLSLSIFLYTFQEKARLEGFLGIRDTGRWSKLEKSREKGKFGEIIEF